MPEYKDSVLADFRKLLDDFAVKENERNSEIIDLMKELTRRFEPLEKEIFDTEGTINEFRQRLKELEEAEQDRTDKKQRRRKILDGILIKAGAVLLVGIVTALFLKFPEIYEVLVK